LRELHHDTGAEVIATMTGKRRSSISRSKKTTSKTTPRAVDKTQSLNGTGLSKDLEEPSGTSGTKDSAIETKRVQLYKADCQRLNAVSETLGYQGLSPAEQLQGVLAWVESHFQDATSPTQFPNSPSKSSDSSLKDTWVNEFTPLMSQLLGTITALTQQFQQQQQTHLQLTAALSHLLQGVELNRGRSSTGASSASGKGTFSSSADSFKGFTSQDLKKSHAKGSAEEKLKRAFQAIASYNDTAKRSHADKWAVNQNALAELTGCNRPAIKAFLKQNASEIEAHHQKHSLLARHNYSHGKAGVKITDIIHW
jgi:hypothetical protein